MTQETELLVAENPDEQAAFGAELLARAIFEAVALRGVARIALSGGTTPSETYKRLAGLELPFASVRWFWVDERAVPPSNPRSNFGAATRDFGIGLADGEGAPTPKGRFFRMHAEAEDRARAAADYERVLRADFGVAASASFDAIVLGVGDDGHTASLFPGLGVVGIDDRLVMDIPAQPKKELEPRLTLTAPAICEARLVVMIAKGANKKDVVKRARESGSEEEMPSRLVQRVKGRGIWLVDRAAIDG